MPVNFLVNKIPNIRVLILTILLIWLCFTYVSIAPLKSSSSSSNFKIEPFPEAFEKDNYDEVVTSFVENVNTTTTPSTKDRSSTPPPPLTLPHVVFVPDKERETTTTTPTPSTTTTAEPTRFPTYTSNTTTQPYPDTAINHSSPQQQLIQLRYNNVTVLSRNDRKPINNSNERIFIDTIDQKDALDSPQKQNTTSEVVDVKSEIDQNSTIEADASADTVRITSTEEFNRANPMDSFKVYDEKVDDYEVQYQPHRFELMEDPIDLSNYKKVYPRYKKPIYEH